MIGPCAGHLKANKKPGARPGFFVEQSPLENRRERKQIA
jgi:hypothetical protein